MSGPRWVMQITCILQSSVLLETLRMNWNFPPFHSSMPSLEYLVLFVILRIIFKMLTTIFLPLKKKYEYSFRLEIRPRICLFIIAKCSLYLVFFFFVVSTLNWSWRRQNRQNSTKQLLKNTNKSIVSLMMDYTPQTNNFRNMQE